MARNEYDDLLSSGDSYDGLLQNEERAKSDAVKQNLQTAVRTDPNTFAKTRTLSARSGMPVQLVERNVAQVEEQEKLTDYDRLLRSTQVVKDKMTDQDFAKLAHDDLASLVTIEELFNKNKKPIPKIDANKGFAAAATELRKQQDAETESRIVSKFMSQGADISTAQNILAGLKVGRQSLVERGYGQGQADYWFSQQVLQPIGQIKTSPFDFDTKKRFEKSNPLVRGVAKGITLMERQAGGAIRFGAETLGVYEEGGALDRANQDLESRMQAIGESANPFDRNLEGAITSIVSQAPALAASVASGGVTPALASMFVQVAGEEFETGRRAGLSYNEATGRAAIFGAAEVIGERFGLGDLIKGLRGAAAGLPTASVLEYITKEVVKQVPGEQLTTAIQFGTDALAPFGLNPDATPEQYLSAVIDTLAQTILQGGIMVGGGVGISAAARAIGRRQEEAQSTVDMAGTLEQVFATAAESQLRVRDAQSFTQLVNEAAELGDGSTSEVYVSAAVLMQAMQDAQIQPNQVPSIAEQLEDAARSGADVVVPVGELAAAFSGTNQENLLLDQLRFNQDGATVSEQREFLAKAQEAFTQEADKISQQQTDQDAFEAKAQSVYDKVMADLTTAGRHSADVNNVLADLVKRFYVVKSAQLGTTPDALYEQYPLRVQGESINTGAVLEQESPEFKAWFGSSKIVDEGGKPLRVYHGTADSFSEFDLNNPNRKDNGWLGDGVYVTDDPDMATAYSNLKAGAAAPNVMPLYVSIENPYTATLEDKRQLKDASKEESQAWTQRLKDAGHDGVVLDYGNGTREIVAFEPTQVKSASGNRGTFDRNDPNILNQEQVNALVAQHNLSAENLLFADKMGGLAVPSLAIANAENPLDGFGEITLLASPKMVDPKGYANAKVYGADIYSPRYPELTYKLGKDALARLNEALAPYGAGTIYSGAVDKTSDLTSMPAFQAYADAQLGKQAGYHEMKTLARDLLTQVGADEKIFMGFTYSGNRRYIDHTMENVVKMLKKELRSGEGFNYGLGSVRANFTPQFKSLTQIRNSKDRIMDSKAFDAVKKEMEQNLFDLADALGQFHEYSSQFGFLDTVTGTLSDAARMGLPRALRENQFDGVTGEVQAQIVEFMEKLRDMPTEYFEVKILRDVSLAEFSGAVVPTDAKPQVIEVLKKNGIENIEYYDRNDEQGRAAAITKFTDLLFQGERGKALGTFDPENFVITLKQGANLSTFLHEVGHFFLEVQADMALATNAPEQVVKDMDAIVRWFGLSNMAEWHNMTLEQKRPHHEKFARGFEAYLFEGNAPSAELQGVFARFRAWLTNVYQSLQQFLQSFDVELTNEVREVMGRMMATDDQIQQAAERRNLAAMFTTAEEAGMTDEEFAEYQGELTDTQVQAVSTMLKRSLADIKWLRRARSKAIREFQKEGESKRSEARMEARREILQQPVYKAWNFLTGKEWGKVGKPESRNSKQLDPSRDSLFTAIAKLGGVNRDAAISEFGLDIEDIKGLQPVFGKPVFRKSGGASLDAMAENLSQYGYITVDENGKYDLAEFEDMIMQELRGEPFYSMAYDYDRDRAEAEANTDEAIRDLAQQLPAGRLNTELVKAMLGDRFEAAKEKIGRMLASDGLHPDIVADLFRDADGVEGFSSGRDMINKLIEAVAPYEAIETLTDQIVLERFGDITSDKAAQEAADQALHNEAMLRAAATEMKAMAKLEGSVTSMARAAKDAAAKAIARVKVKDLRPAKYAAAAMRFGRAAQDALAKKDIEGALAAKRQQFLNIAMTQRGYEVQGQMRKAMQEFARLRRSDKTLAKTHDINLVDTARAVLSTFGINDTGAIGNPLAALEALDKVKAYNPDLYAVLEPIAKAAMEASRDEMGNPIDYRSLTVEGFEGLRETVRQLMHQARAEKQMMVDGKMVDLEAAREALIEQQKQSSESKPVGQREAVTDKDRQRFTLSGMRAGLRRMEAWVESQDLGATGAFRTYLFDQVSAAITKYRTVKNVAVKRYVELLRAKQLEGDFTDTKIDAQDDFGYTFAGKQELLGALLHTGNESNRRKLLLGRGWGEMTEVDGQKVLNSSRFDAFIERMQREGTLTKSDYDFLQATWDLMDSLKADAQKAHFYLYGYYFDEVTAQPINTQFGVYRGGYAPAKADAELVADAAIRQGVNEIEQDFNYLMPSTGNGFTKGRVDYNRPLVMDLRLVAQHIDQVLRFSYIQPAVSDTLKLVKRGSFSAALNEVDPQVTRSLILPWLQRSATQTVTQPWQGEDGKALQRFFTGLRRNTGMAIMTANLVNALQQVTGLSLTAVKVEPRYMKGALARYMRSPAGSATAIAEQSDWMKIRLTDQSFEMQAELQQIMEGGSETKGFIQRHAYFMQRAMQNMVDIITWSAAYDKAIGDKMTEQEAVRYADSIVRTTQGSLLPEDISRFESGNAFTQLFTQFASYFNMQANLLGTEFSKIARTMGVKKGAGRALYVYTMGFMIPAVMADAIVRTFGWDWDDDDDDGYFDEFAAWFFGSQARTALAMFPGVGQLGQLFMNKFNGNFYDDRLSTSPAIGAIESASGAPVSVYKAVFEDGSIKRAIRDTLTLLSLRTGIPFSALARPLGYSADYMQGKVEPENALDLARGLASGRGREEERQ